MFIVILWLKFSRVQFSVTVGSSLLIVQFTLMSSQIIIHIIKIAISVLTISPVSLLEGGVKSVIAHN